jgi:curved DNA-binding protein CbpA
MKYFVNVKTLEDVKELYRVLTKKYHPDLNKDIDTTVIMQQINAEYETAFMIYKNIHRNIENEVYESKTENSETPEEFQKIINSVIFMGGCKVELVGKWIWISGNTLQYKDKLKSLGFSWCKNKTAWAWHLPEDNTKNKHKMSLEQIRARYGSVEYETKFSVLR